MLLNILIDRSHVKSCKVIYFDLKRFLRIAIDYGYYFFGCQEKNLNVLKEQRLIDYSIYRLEASVAINNYSSV